MRFERCGDLIEVDPRVEILWRHSLDPKQLVDHVATGGPQLHVGPQLEPELVGVEPGRSEHPGHVVGVREELVGIGEPLATHHD